MTLKLSEKTIDTLVTDIEKLFEGHMLTEALTGQFSKGLSDLFVNRFKEYGIDRPNTLRLSNIGQPLRKLWYTVKGFKQEPLTADTKVKFLLGDLVECLFAFLAKEAGHSVEFEQQEVEVDGVPGHLDYVVDGVLVDAKSCSTFSYKKFITGEIYNSDPFGYVAQLEAYRTAKGLTRAGWFIVDKTLGHFAFVELNPPVGYDVHQRIVTVKAALESDVEPAHCYAPKPVSKTDKTGNMVLDTGCSFCGFKVHCWREANNGEGLKLRQYSTGPKWFTTLVKEPNLKYQQQDVFDTFPFKETE